MFKQASQKCLYITVVVPPDSTSPTPSTFSAMKTPENTQEELEYPEPVAEGDIQMEYSFA
jgi:hypothetical protein